MAERDNRPNFRIVAKKTERRTDRFEGVGVAWAKKNEEGRTVITLKFSPFIDGNALVTAEAVLLVPAEYGDRGARAPRDNAPRDNATGGATGSANDEQQGDGFVDDDIPF